VICQSSDGHGVLRIAMSYQNDWELRNWFLELAFGCCVLGNAKVPKNE
jgi:hypothetical protein